MKKRIQFALLVCTLLLSGCTAVRPTDQREEPAAELTVVATTYPVYLFASAVTDGVDGVAVQRLNTGETSCLHDYTLSVDDMKKLERADVIAMNGLELEEFMEAALASSDALVIDCSAGVPALESRGHSHEDGETVQDGHDHGHYDPHIWMDPANARTMVANLAQALSEADQVNAQQYADNARKAQTQLEGWEEVARQTLGQFAQAGGEAPDLITFHDGFQYFANAFDLPLLASIEEEEGSTASAKEIVEIAALVEEHGLRAIFTEVNGSQSTARAIGRETGCRVEQLTMLMDGPDGQLSRYRDGLMANVSAIVNGFAG